MVKTLKLYEIITKFKDFYDYEVGYDSDDSLVWDRTKGTQLLGTSADSKAKECGLDKVVMSLKSDETYTSGVYYRNKQNDNTVYVDFKTFYVGIYPCVYKIVTFFVNSYSVIIDELNGKILDEDTFEHYDEFIESIKNKYKDRYKFHFPPIRFYWARSGSAANFGKRSIECEEVFKKLDTPTFLYEPYFQFYTDYIVCTNGIKGLPKYIKSVGSNRDFYTDIENFLYSQKSEPISTQDNNSKIVSHGFDLKTSFRKM